MGRKIKVNLINYLSVRPLVHIYLYIGHHFKIENIKNEFTDLKNLFKHVLHIEILHNPIYVDYITLFFNGIHFEKWLPF